MPTTPKHLWFCPLLNREIASGYCLDINYQRLGYFQEDVLQDVKQQTRKSVAEISEVCEKCPNQPLPDEQYTQNSTATKRSL